MLFLGEGKEGARGRLVSLPGVVVILRKKAQNNRQTDGSHIQSSFNPCGRQFDRREPSIYLFYSQNKKQKPTRRIQKTGARKKMPRLSAAHHHRRRRASRPRPSSGIRVADRLQTWKRPANTSAPSICTVITRVVPPEMRAWPPGIPRNQPPRFWPRPVIGQRPLLIGRRRGFHQSEAGRLSKGRRPLVRNSSVKALAATTSSPGPSTYQAGAFFWVLLDRTTCGFLTPSVHSASHIHTGRRCVPRRHPGP